MCLTARIEISRRRRENNPSVMARGHDSFPYTGKPLDGTQLQNLPLGGRWHGEAVTEGEKVSVNRNFLIDDTASVSPSVSFADSSLVRGSLWMVRSRTASLRKGSWRGARLRDCVLALCARTAGFARNCRYLRFWCGFIHYNNNNKTIQQRKENERWQKAVTVAVWAAG